VWLPDHIKTILKIHYPIWSSETMATKRSFAVWAHQTSCNQKIWAPVEESGIVEFEMVRVWMLRE